MNLFNQNYHIDLSTLVNLYNIYILPIQIRMRKFQLEKKKKKWGAREILWKNYW